MTDKDSAAVKYNTPGTPSNFTSQGSFAFLHPTTMTVQNWQEISRAKQAATSKLVETWLPPDFSVDDKLLNVMDMPAKYLSQRDNEITLLPATELIEQMRSGSLKSEDVVKAFCKRAAIAHKLVWILLTIQITFS